MSTAIHVRTASQDDLSDVQEVFRRSSLSNEGGVVPRTAAGIGLDHGTVRLARTTEEWLRLGSQLRVRVSEQLDGGG